MSTSFCLKNVLLHGNQIVVKSQCENRGTKQCVQYVCVSTEGQWQQRKQKKSLHKCHWECLELPLHYQHDRNLNMDFLPLSLPTHYFPSFLFLLFHFLSFLLHFSFPFFSLPFMPFPFFHFLPFVPFLSFPPLLFFFHLLYFLFLALYFFLIPFFTILSFLSFPFHSLYSFNFLSYFLYSLLTLQLSWHTRLTWQMKTPHTCHSYFFIPYPLRFISRPKRCSIHLLTKWWRLASLPQLCQQQQHSTAAHGRNSIHLGPSCVNISFSLNGQNRWEPWGGCGQWRRCGCGFSERVQWPCPQHTHTHTSTEWHMRQRWV